MKVLAVLAVSPSLFDYHGYYGCMECLKPIIYPVPA